MTPNDGLDVERFEAMRDRGATPDDAYREAKAAGLQLPDVIRVLRRVFSLSYVDAREVHWRATGHPLAVIRAISSRAQLIAYLKRELGYCGCAAYQNALILLRGALTLAREQADGLDLDPVGFGRKRGR